MEMMYFAATEQDLAFIKETYEENIDSLHGNERSMAVWKKLLSQKDSAYYIVRGAAPLAWFRLDLEEDALWLGMVQVKPEYHRQGVGKFILSVAEAMGRERGFDTLGVHTTEDNLPARGLYLQAGYVLTEIGPCTTADGIDRVGYTFQKRI